MIVYLVIDDYPAGNLSYKDKWKIFMSPDKALAHAKECGYGASWLGVWGDAFSQVGMATEEKCGDVDITLIAVEVS